MRQKTKKRKDVNGHSSYLGYKKAGSPIQSQTRRDLTENRL